MGRNFRSDEEGEDPQEEVTRRLTMRAALLAAVLFGAAGEKLTAGADSQDGAHWSFQPYARPMLPVVVREEWVRTPVDSFILARLEKASVRPAKPALAETLIRRIQLDLIGLPPKPTEVAAFRATYGRDANASIRQLVDRLLSSPHYGERWGRHWLDLARFAETDGFEHDAVRPHSWRYRDYVISSFNSDKPFDRFAREQIAGDELWADDPQAQIATGFNLLGPDMVDSSDQVQRRLNSLNDMTDTTASVFLGLTLGCAKCHDHPFEPVTQREYYQMQAFYTPTDFVRARAVPTAAERRSYDAAVRRYAAESNVKNLRRFDSVARSRLEAKKGNRKYSTKELISSLSNEQKNERRKLEKAIRLKKPELPHAMTLAYPQGEWRKTFLLHRGDHSQPKGRVSPGFPKTLGAGDNTSTSRRELAQWIGSRENPRSARIMVNRIWQHHFGRGLVANASEWGVQTAEPLHLELLNWLGDEFVRRGWSVKEMHRLILNSATYRQSIDATAGARHSDQGNRLYARWSPLRVEGEVVRDSLLALGGELNSAMLGRSVYPPIPAELFRGAKGWNVSPEREDHVRRSVYIFGRRNLRFPFLEVFDAPDSNLSCAARETSTTAPQSLTLLNADDVVKAAHRLAERIHNGTPGAKVRSAYQAILGRAPRKMELSTAVAFLETSPLSELCRALFNVNEFVYVN
ncbi:MAG: hypothetical protein ACI9OD_001587 [Limisphaerales bacterium]|jgi:hypothetical protein